MTANTEQYAFFSYFFNVIDKLPTGFYNIIMVQSMFGNLIASNTVQNAKAIHGTLSYAKAHKIEIFIDIISEGKTIHQVRAYCIDHNKSIIRLFIQTKQAIKLPQSAEVSAFFYIQEAEKQVPCNFISVIKNSFIHKGLFFIDIAVPSYIGHTQRRNCVRIPITKAEIPNLKLWVESKTDESEQLQWVAVQENEFDIVDISAGGILFLIDAFIPVSRQIKENSKILLTGIFPYTNKAPLCLSMLATVRRFTKNANSPEWFSMGIRFIRWAYLENYSTWNSIPDDNGIPPLVNWVFQVMANRKRG